MIWLLPLSLPPLPAVCSTPATQWKTEKERQLVDGRGGGEGEGAISYNDEKAWSSIIYKILSEMDDG
jgi:hypothetical protein